MHAGILPFKQPKNQSEALFSLPFCASMALLTGNLTITDIKHQSWQREDVKQLIPKISIHSFKPDRPELNYDPEQPDRIVMYRNGEQQTINIPYPLGSPQRPMTQQQLLQKFQLNANLDEAGANHLWQNLRNWPTADDIHGLLSVPRSR